MHKVKSLQTEIQMQLRNVYTNMVPRQFCWKVFANAVLENKFSPITHPFRNKRRWEFKHLWF